jgi:hypothetical protein
LKITSFQGEESGSLQQASCWGSWLHEKAKANPAGQTHWMGTSNDQFIRIRYEIEKGLEAGLVLPFVQPVVKGAFLGMATVLFLLFYKQAGGKDLAAEISVVKTRLEYVFVEALQLRNSELFR